VRELEGELLLALAEMTAKAVDPAQHWGRWTAWCASAWSLSILQFQSVEMSASQSYQKEQAKQAIYC
jgi:hypothetical protein